jgi:hypothetical protein
MEEGGEHGQAVRRARQLEEGRWVGEPVRSSRPGGAEEAGGKVARRRSAAGVAIQVGIFWDGDLVGLRLLFTFEPAERWNIASDGIVYGSAGIDRPEPGESDHRWRDDGPTLNVIFPRSKFGGSDTWHIRREDVNLPVFEPVPDWAPSGNV